MFWIAFFFLFAPVKIAEPALVCFMSLKCNLDLSHVLNQLFFKHVMDCKVKLMNQDRWKKHEALFCVCVCSMCGVCILYSLSEHTAKYRKGSEWSYYSFICKITTSNPTTEVWYVTDVTYVLYISCIFSSLYNNSHILLHKHAQC